MGLDVFPAVEQQLLREKKLPPLPTISIVEAVDERLELSWLGYGEVLTIEFLAYGKKRDAIIILYHHSEECVAGLNLIPIRPRSFLEVGQQFWVW